MSEPENAVKRRSLLRGLAGSAALGLAGAAGLLRPAAAAPVAASLPAGGAYPILRKVGISVADLDRSAKFYRDIFGFKPAGQPNKIGPELSNLAELENLSVTSLHLDSDYFLGRIELLAFKNPHPVGDGKRRPLNERGLAHFLVRVPDMDATLTTARNAGANILENTRFVGKDGITKAIFMADPDGTRVEISSAETPRDALVPVIRQIGIAVADLAASRRFYSEAFGFTPEGTPRPHGSEFDGLSELKNVKVLAQHMETGGMMRLEFLQFDSPRTAGDGRRRPMNRRGLSHIQIQVPDITATLEAVAKAGGTVLENTRFIGKDGQTKAIFAVDPDGTRVEILPIA